MNLRETGRIAARALRRNLTRSVLTTLGVVIGVGSVIAMVAIGDGAKARVEEAFTSMGSNLLVVLPGSFMGGGAMGGSGTLPTVTWDDLKAIQTELSAVHAAAAELRSMLPVSSEEQNWTTMVTGTSPEFLEIRSWKVERGSPMAQSDVDGAVKVAWVGKTLVERLFGSQVDPIGALIRVKGVPFTIAGVLERKGQTDFGMDQDDVAIVPCTAYLQKLQGSLKTYIPGAVLLSATSDATTQLAERQVRELLRDRHRLPPEADDDFHVGNLAAFADARKQGTETISTLLASIAAISLLIGGVGIMNIMLVSVTERTREIGLRMAVGATPSDIRRQFLAEALTLSLAGGALGLLIGVVVAGQVASAFGWSVLYRPTIALLAIGLSAAVGVIFGLYPAHRASRMDPIEALRFE